MNVQGSASTAPPDRQLPAASAPPPRRRHRWIWAAVLIAFALLFYWVFSEQRKNQAAVGGRHMMTGPVPVIPATAKTGDLGVYLDAIGTVTPVYTDSMTAEVTGLIEAVHYREGQYVHKGDPLIDIDPRPYAAQLVQAQGALERDQGMLAEAQMDLKRYEVAWAKNAIPRQTLEDQEKLVVQAQGTVKNDQGLVQYDQVQLGFCHITSPITGRVGLRLMDPGNLVTANSATTLVVVTQVEPITVIFTIAEDSLQEVLDHMHPGAPLTVEAWDRSNASKLATGKLMTVDNQIDTTTGTVKLRAEFENRHEELFPNEFVNTRLLVTTMRNQTVLPSSAIQHNGDVAFVYRIESGPPVRKTGAGAAQGSGANQGHGTVAGNGATQATGPNQTGRVNPSGVPGGAPGAGKAKYHAVMQTVKTGITDGGMTAVEGIEPGTVVADSSFEKLVDNAPVMLSNTTLNVHQTTISGESSAP